MSEENIVKRVCKELNLTQRELAERMAHHRHNGLLFL